MFKSLSATALNQSRYTFTLYFYSSPDLIQTELFRRILYPQSLKLKPVGFGVAIRSNPEATTIYSYTYVFVQDSFGIKPTNRSQT
ncbi:hypothetical protein ALP59_01983 [Pseudomonas savastanoi]|uniref:Uncharacterized protein n=1 Tax=Pseudomonas savastanoi TaxID=29438 RepID=A0A3M5GH53_PSESS|nr:hypothetical protein ALP59_01983 [Pseudomonas savastanoi]